METELRSGFPLFRQQFIALLRKNLLLSWRNKRATSLQLLSSLFFIFLIFCIQEAIKSRFSTTTYYENVTDPPAIVSPPIPACEEKYYIKSPCFDFVWSGNLSKTVGTIVSNIMKNNPGRSIPSSKVLSFETPDDVDDWLFKNPMRCPGALHFVERNATFISYGIQTNSTPLIRRGNFEDPTFKFQIPLQIAAEREIARTLLKDPGFSWNVGLKEFAHPAIETFSAVGTAGPTFFLATAMFGFVFQVSSLISEKELKLRQALSIMGLYDSAYWLSWLTWETTLTLISSLFIVLFGMMFQFRFFLSNSFGVLFLLFFLFQFNMIGLAFMISTFISKSSSATTVGFSIFIIGFLTQLVTTFGFPYGTDFSRTYQIIWSFFPPNLLSHALKLLGDATANAGDKGISFQRRGECPDAVPNCVLTIDGIYKWLITTFFLWFFLAIYFDNIIPNSNGVRKSCFYFLYPSYWTGKGGNRATEGSICSCIGTTPPLEDEPQNDEDVIEEEITVRRQAVDNRLNANVAVQIRGLVKIYPGTTRLVGCCRCQRSSPYHAVKGIWVNFPKDQLFCLLGPNGAGKTTVINSLTGITPVSSGDALIYGYSVRSSVGMSYIRKMIGVCPQFDILWDSLSGKEHLHLFASIKGLPPASIASVAEKSLAEVKLIDAADMRAGSYSGGMKRRLSVAIALIGDPKLVFLDEPTTGMDPITRRHVWDIIEDAKKGRAIVLTTHSMEEADILSDRIAIMARGKLRCIGTSIRLKSKFGAGYVANVSFGGSSPERTPNHNGNPRQHETSHAAVKQFFKYRDELNYHFKVAYGTKPILNRSKKASKLIFSNLVMILQHLGVVPKEENKSFLTFVIPNEKEPLLTKFFAELQDKEAEFGISDIQLGLTTLEEVFLNIAKKAELESSFAEGSLVTLNLTSGTSVQILKGARYVGIPGTETAENPRGVMVEVYWEQDDAGELCISGHSEEMPIPPNVQTSANVGGIWSRSRRSRSHGLPVGTVIDPDQVQRPTGF